MTYIILNKYKYYLSIFSIVIVFCFSLFQVESSIFISFCVFGLIGTFLASVLGKTEKNIFIIIYSYTVLFSLILYFIFHAEHGVPYQGGGSDSKSFELKAELLSKSDFIKYDIIKIGEIIGEPYHNSPGYIYVVFLLNKMSNLFGSFHTMIPRLFNVFILAISCPFVFYIGLELGLDRKKATNSCIISGILPITSIVASQTYREVIVMSVFIFSVYFSIKYLNSNFYKKIFILFIFFFLSLIILQFRFLNVINVLSTIITSLIITSLSIKKLNYQKIFLFFILLIFIYFLFSENYLLVNLFSTLEVYNQSLIEGVDRANENGFSLILFSLPSILKELALLIYSTITPLPILYTQYIEFNYLSIGTVIQFCYMPFLFVGFYLMLDNVKAAGMNLLFLITLMGYVYGSFSFRHIVYLVPFATIYIYKGLAFMPNYNGIVLRVQLMIIIFIISMYYTLKYLI